MLYITASLQGCVNCSPMREGRSSQNTFFDKLSLLDHSLHGRGRYVLGWQAVMVEIWTDQLETCNIF